METVIQWKPHCWRIVSSLSLFVYGFYIESLHKNSWHAGPYILVKRSRRRLEDIHWRLLTVELIHSWAAISAGRPAADEVSAQLSTRRSKQLITAVATAKRKRISWCKELFNWEQGENLMSVVHKTYRQKFQEDDLMYEIICLNVLRFITILPSFFMISTTSCSQETAHKSIICCRQAV
jgi:hypothetical protein